MPSHSEGPWIWFSVWRFRLTHCLYERAAEVLTRLRGCAGSPEPSLLAQAISTKFAWRGPLGVSFIAKLLNLCFLFIRNKSVNDQGGKLKNHKLTHRLVPSSLWLQKWCKLYQACWIMSQKHHQEFSALLTRCSFMQMPESKHFSQHHKMILFVYFAVKWIGTKIQFRLNSWVSSHKGA